MNQFQAAHYAIATGAQFNVWSEANSYWFGPDHKDAGFYVSTGRKIRLVLCFGLPTHLPPYLPAPVTWSSLTQGGLYRALTGGQKLPKRAEQWVAATKSWEPVQFKSEVFEEGVTPGVTYRVPACDDTRFPFPDEEEVMKSCPDRLAVCDKFRLVAKYAGDSEESPPDYHNLQAMFQVQSLLKQGHWVRYLKLIGPGPKAAASASAETRLEAFGIVTGLWKSGQ